jgi:hypothetical protein
VHVLTCILPTQLVKSSVVIRIEGMIGPREQHSVEGLKYGKMDCIQQISNFASNMES